LLETRTVTGFSGGQYWRWTVRGHVVVRAQVTAGYNAVVSGVFFDGGGAVNAPPTVTLTAPASGAQYTAPATVAVSATASDSDGIAKVEFYQVLGQGTPSLIAPAVTTPPYAVTWYNVAAGTYTVTAKAYDTQNASSTTSVQMTVVPVGGGTAATFIGTDTTTKGTWRGVYGAEGYVIVNDATSPPAYASVAVTGANTWPWTEVTTDVRGLQRAVGANRFAATWYGSTFTVDVNITDGAAHQLSLYVVDWDSNGRVETVEVRDAVTNGLLDTRSISSFVGGQYWRWTVSGHVTMRVTNTGTPNAVVSGLFFDTSASNLAPAVAVIVACQP
ncbi:MAG TPA: Ig-like domain-containing protein, partial [Vicinamibacterales bacterium]|nr:Ig-like domain-containing protein [Vicinamibacterales bacterium]